MKKILLALTAVIFLLPSTASAQPLSADVIVGLLDAGVSDSSIERYVVRNGFTFDLTAEDLKALKKAGASDALIEFLQDRQEGAPSGTPGEETRPSAGSGEQPGYVMEAPPGDYAVSTYGPAYSLGFYVGYPYYAGYPYYPYYNSYYYGSYYHYPYYPYGYHYPCYRGGGHGGGSGVVSYWHGGQSGRGTARPPASARPGVTPRPPHSPPHSSMRGVQSSGRGRR